MTNSIEKVKMSTTPHQSLFIVTWSSQNLAKLSRKLSLIRDFACNKALFNQSKICGSVISHVIHQTFSSFWLTSNSFRRCTRGVNVKFSISIANGGNQFYKDRRQMNISFTDSKIRGKASRCYYYKLITKQQKFNITYRWWTDFTNASSFCNWFDLRNVHKRISELLQSWLKNWSFRRRNKIKIWIYHSFKFHAHVFLSICCNSKRRTWARNVHR